MEIENVNYKQIPVIIPSYEPDLKLVGLIRELVRAGVKNIVVVDDGSGEAYFDLFEQVRQEGCTLLRHSVNLGKGRALKTAFNYCLQEYKDMPGCVSADSDGQHSPGCILRCTKELWEYPESLILGCREFDAKEVPFRSRFGNKITCRTFRYLAGISISDTQTGLRAIPNSLMEKLMNVKGERFEFETNMLLETKRDEIPIREVKIETIYIEDNQMSHFHPIRDSLKIYRVFAKFLYSSLSSSVVDLLLFALFCQLMRGAGWKEGIYITAATAAARVISAIYNYFINYRVVFCSKKSVKRTGFRYLILAVVQAGCSAFLVNLLYPLFGGYEVMVKIPVDVLLFFLSFMIQRELVYR